MIDTPVSTSLPKSLYVLLMETYIFCLMLLSWVILVSWNDAMPIAPATFLLLSLLGASAASITTIILIWYREKTEQIAAAYDVGQCYTTLGLRINCSISKCNLKHSTSHLKSILDSQHTV